MNHDYSQGVLDGLQSAFNAVSTRGDDDKKNIETIIYDLIQEAYEHV